MKKTILNEEIAKMRKMMGLNENYDIDSHYEDSIMGDLPGETQEPENDNNDDLIEFNIPNWAVSALINGDHSGLTDEEESKLNEFVKNVVSKYGNAHFMVDDYEKSDLGFLRSNDIDNLGGDCTMLLIRPSENQDQVAIDAHDEEEANKYASKNYDDIESGVTEGLFGFIGKKPKTKTVGDYGVELMKVINKKPKLTAVVTQFEPPIEWAMKIENKSLYGNDTTHIKPIYVGLSLIKDDPKMVNFYISKEPFGENEKGTIASIENLSEYTLQVLRSFGNLGL